MSTSRRRASATVPRGLARGVLALSLLGLSMSPGVPPALPTAQAADGDGRFMVKGAGISRCEDFSAAVAERGAAFYSYAGWIEGYLSAMNRYEAGVYDHASWHSTDMLMAAIDRACEQQPQASFHAMVNQLANSLRRNAIAEQSPLVPIQNERIGMVLYAETLRRLQAALRQRGFKGVEVSGAFDVSTREALLEFQKSRGLEPTGLPDQPTLASLLP